MVIYTTIFGKCCQPIPISQKLPEPLSVTTTAVPIYPALPKRRESTPPISKAEVNSLYNMAAMHEKVQTTLFHQKLNTSRPCSP